AKQDYCLAIVLYTKAIKLGCMKAYYNRANCYRRLGDNETSLQDYTKAVEYDPCNPMWWNNYGNALKAISETTQAPAYSTLCFVRAEECFHKALALDPKYNNALYNYGNLLHSVGRNEEAVLFYNRVAVTDKKLYHDAQYNAGRAARDLKCFI